MSALSYKMWFTRKGKVQNDDNCVFQQKSLLLYTQIQGFVKGTIKG